MFWKPKLLRQLAHKAIHTTCYDTRYSYAGRRFGRNIPLYITTKERRSDGQRRARRLHFGSKQKISLLALRGNDESHFCPTCPFSNNGQKQTALSNYSRKQTSGVLKCSLHSLIRAGGPSQDDQLQVWSDAAWHKATREADNNLHWTTGWVRSSTRRTRFTTKVEKPHAARTDSAHSINLREWSVFDLKRSSRSHLGDENVDPITESDYRSEWKLVKHSPQWKQTNLQRKCIH